MSVYCIPKDGLREMFPSSGPKMFVKVGNDRRWKDWGIIWVISDNQGHVEDNQHHIKDNQGHVEDG